MVQATSVRDWTEKQRTRLLHNRKAAERFCAVTLPVHRGSRHLARSKVQREASERVFDGRHVARYIIRIRGAYARTRRRPEPTGRRHRSPHGDRRARGAHGA